MKINFILSAFYSNKSQRKTCNEISFHNSYTRFSLRVCYAEMPKENWHNISRQEKVVHSDMKLKNVYFNIYHLKFPRWYMLTHKGRDSRRRGLCDFVGTAAAAVESSSSSSQATRRINTLSGFLPLKKIFQKRGTQIVPNCILIFIDVIFNSCSKLTSCEIEYCSYDLNWSVVSPV